VSGPSDPPASDSLALVAPLPAAVTHLCCARRRHRCLSRQDNIDWQAAGPKGSDARMNQFVPQLMLGNPLCNSTGAPDFKPIWHEESSWVFGAQYFFELFNETANATQGHAATGETFPVKEGEVIFTRYTLSKAWVWTLEMVRKTPLFAPFIFFIIFIILQRQARDKHRENSKKSGVFLRE
jgi:hypothetical protein